MASFTLAFLKYITVSFQLLNFALIVMVYVLRTYIW